MPMQGRVKIASAFNQAIAKGYWNHSRTRSRCFRNRLSLQETSNIYDGSVYSRYGSKRDWRQFRGATWVSIHNGGGVGWGEVINGGFGWI
jgi:urocanate hydratase